MSGNYTMAISREQYDKENERFLTLQVGGFRDNEVNLCDIGDTRLDAAKIIEAFQDEKITEEFIEKMERLLTACGTLEAWEIEHPIKWFKKNIGQSFVLVYE